MNNTAQNVFSNYHLTNSFYNLAYKNKNIKISKNIVVDPGVTNITNFF